jgi:hypothetical protein
MVELSHYRGPLLVVGAIVGMLGLINLLLSGLLGRSTHRLEIDGEKPTDWAVVERVGGQLSAVMADGKRPGARPTPLAVILGQSTAQDGLDPAVLNARSGLPLHWLGLCGDGGSILKINELAQLLYRSGLRPKVVVLAIGPEMLVGVPNPAPDEPAPLPEILKMLATGDLQMARQAMNNRIWLARNSRLVNHDFRHLLYRARIHWLASFGLNVDAMFPPDKQPWILTPHEAPFYRPEEDLARQLAAYEQFGWFDPQAYTPESANARALVDLISRCRSLGAEVLFVVMPAKSSFRAKVPPEAEACLTRLRTEELGATPPPLINIWDALPDEMFRDYLHLNPLGRERVSELLASRLRRQLTDATRQAPE